MNKLFQVARVSALHTWLEVSGRELLYTDDYTMIREEVSNNYECQWQQKNWHLHEKTKQKENHVSIFCSLNTWASHITDLLMDTQFDNVILYPDIIEDTFFDEAKGDNVDVDTYDHHKLSRHYGRFLLVASELLVDFGDIAKHLGETDFKAYFSKDNIFGYSAVRGYINNVFKHKTSNFHVCNHHVPLLFCDGYPPRLSYESNDKDYLIEIGCSHKYDVKGVKYILSHPRLIDLVSFLGKCYEHVHALLTDENIMILAEKYGDKYSNSND